MNTIDPLVKKKIDKLEASFTDDKNYIRIKQNLNLINCASTTPSIGGNIEQDNATTEIFSANTGFNTHVDVANTTMTFDTNKYKRNSVKPTQSIVYNSANQATPGEDTINTIEALPNSNSRIRMIAGEVKLTASNNTVETPGFTPENLNTGYLKTGSITSSFSSSGNLVEEDGSYATYTRTSFYTYILAGPVRSFGASIPDYATITGIAVKVKGLASHSSGTNYVNLESPTLDLNGSHYALTTPITQKLSSALNTAYIYGSTSDLSEWASLPTITPAMINSSNFGMNMNCSTYSDGTSVIAYIDCIQIIVYYTTHDPFNPGGNNSYATLYVDAQRVSDDGWDNLVTKGIQGASNAFYGRTFNYIFENDAHSNTYYKNTRTQLYTSTYSWDGYAYSAVWCADTGNSNYDTSVDKEMLLSLKTTTKTITYVDVEFTPMPLTTVSETDWSPQQVNFTTLKYILIDSLGNETSELTSGVKNAVTGLTGNPVSIRLVKFIPSDVSFSTTSTTSTSGNFEDKYFLEGYPYIKDLSVVYWTI